jgi:hypothetical protein
VNESAVTGALVPPAAVTVTSTVPALPAGEIATIDVSLFTVKLVAGVEPKVTPVAPVKPVPVIVTAVPPLGEPVLGDSAVTVGGGGTTMFMYVYWLAAVDGVVPATVETDTFTLSAVSPPGM